MRITGLHISTRTLTSTNQPPTSTFPPTHHCCHRAHLHFHTRITHTPTTSRWSANRNVQNSRTRIYIFKPHSHLKNVISSTSDVCAQNTVVTLRAITFIHNHHADRIYRIYVSYRKNIHTSHNDLLLPAT